MKLKLKEIAQIVDGKVVGDQNTSISGAAGIEEAKKDDITFVLDKKNLAAAESSKAAALIIPEGEKTKKPAVEVKNPRLAMALLLEKLRPKEKIKPGIHKSAVIGENLKIGKDSSVGANVVIGNDVKIGSGTKIYPGVCVGNNVVIGSESVIHPNAVIYDNIKIGDRVILHAGSVIGVDGYGFVFHGGRHVKVPQIGTVIIEDDVEIYANTCVARATLGATIIKRGTKIDNLTHIAHNCVIGEDCALTGLIGFAGSVTLGNRVFAGGQVGFNGHIDVGENTVIMAKSGVTKNIPANSIISGFPAQDHKKEMEMQAALRMLPKLIKKVEELKKKLEH